ncbi:kelch domain-containing protein 9-like, partial [Argonauta hians]
MAEGTVSVNWTVICQDGPARVHHTAGVIKNKLYIHGGLDNEHENQPVNTFYCLDLSTSRSQWKEIPAKGSPYLSNHASVVLRDRYMLLIGGWNGKSRSPDLHCFDTATSLWTELRHSGYPKEAGLSSHTTTLCENGDILVVGREGHLHSQRRYNSSYNLRGDPARDGSFKFSLLSYEVASRSGHTCSSDGHYTYIIGGRKDNLYETIVGSKAVSQISPSTAKKLKAICERLHPVEKDPAGRNFHVSVGGYGVIFIHGGVTFDKCLPLPSGDMYAFLGGGTRCFYHLGVSNVSLKGHVCCCYGDKIIIHGGTSGKNGVVKGQTYSIDLLC